jgi:hypothetical protein
MFRLPAFRCDENNYSLKYIISQSKSKSVAEQGQDIEANGDAIMA